MRYFYEKPDIYIPIYGETYICDHPIYDRCTLYKHKDKGLAVIQQRFDPATKHTYWCEIDPWLVNDIYLAHGFDKYFEEHASVSINGIFNTVSVRQIMWSLRMKPIKRQRWETVFDRKDI